MEKQSKLSLCLHDCFIIELASLASTGCLVIGLFLGAFLPNSPNRILIVRRNCESKQNNVQSIF